MEKECYISVDVEASGPIPGEYSMLSLGACLVDNVSKTFYTEFKPINNNYESKSLKISGFSLEKLKETGVNPAQGMQEFDNWIKKISHSRKPVFVAFNATFDWMFVAYYFHKLLGHNPFGISGLDIKAFYMGRLITSWAETSKKRLGKQFLSDRKHTHNALEDSIEQAEIFRKMLMYGNR